MPENTWLTEQIASLNLPLCRDLLSESRAKLMDGLDSSVTPSTSQEEIVRSWSESVADQWSQLRRYLEIFASSKNTAPSSTVRDPEASGEIHRGLYRQAFIRRAQRQGVTYLVQVLRRGFMSEPKWDEARIVQGVQAPGNGSSVPAVANTTSANPEYYKVVRFMGVDPASEKSFLAAIQASDWTDRTIGPSDAQILLDGVWHGIRATTEQADDGSLTINFILARPQFTLNAYRDFGGTNQATIHYLWNVPKAKAQEIINTWKGTGKSATPSFGSNESLVDLVLSESVTPEDGVNVENFDTACDTAITYHLGWGLTQQEVNAFVDSHPPPANMAGVSRTLNIQARGDGFFDIVIAVTTTTWNAGKHIIQHTSFAGDSKILSAREFGWNIPLSQLDIRRAAWASGVAGKNKQSDFQVKRKDNCTFDYEGTLVTYAEQTGSFSTTGTDGIKSSVQAKKYSDGPTGPATAPRTRHELRCETNDVGTVHVWVQTIEVPVVTDDVSVPASSDTAGIAESVWSGKNVDVGYVRDTLLPTIVASAGVRDRFTLYLQPNDDKSVDYRLTRSKVAKASFATQIASTSAGGIKHTIASGDNMTPSEVVGALQSAGITPGKRKRINVSTEGKDDGAIRFRGDVAEVKEVIDSADGVGATSYGEKMWAGKNTDIGKLQSTVGAELKSGPGRYVSIEISPNDDDTIDWRVKSKVVPSVDVSGETGAGDTGSIESYSWVNAAENEIDPPAIAPRVAVDLDVRANEDGTVNAMAKVRRTVEVKGVKTIDASSGTEGLKVEAYAGRNVDEANIASTLATLGARQRISGSISANEDKTFDYQFFVVTEQDAETPAVTAGDAGGPLSKAKAGINVTSQQLADAAAAMSGGAGIRVDLDVSCNPDGSFNYRMVSVEAPAVSASINAGSGRTPSVLSVGSGAKSQSDIPSSAPGDNEVMEAILEVAPDGSLSWRREVTTLHPRTFTAYAKERVYGCLISVTVEVAKWQKDPPAPFTTTPPAGTDVDIGSVEIDRFGLYSWVKTTTVITPGSSYTVDASNFTDRRRDVVYSRYSGGVYRGVVRKYSRNVTSQTTRSFSVSPVNASAANGERELVSDVWRGKIFAKDHSAINYGEWQEDGLEAIGPLSLP